jgi:bifunctional oligoribonuclease and PAP phosphatase NrnA
MKIQAVKTGIEKNKRFLVSSHVNPEGDSIGSQLAMASLLRRLGKDVVIVNESPVPHLLDFMPGSDKILKEKPSGWDFEAVVILDCPDLSRTGKVSEYITRDKTVINIDHHISNVNFGKYNWVEPGVSSAGEMVFELFKAFKMEIRYEEAMVIYAAIMTDTGSFRYSNTSSRTHVIVSELMEAGVKPYDMHSMIYEMSSLEDTKLLGEALRALKVSDDGKIAWLWVTKDMLKSTRASLEGTEGIIDFARSLRGVEVAIFFRETGTENRIKVSFRSKGKADVNKLASFFGGGGHVTASGCNVFGTMEDVEKKVLEKAVSVIAA